jgi:hypothetical protein
MDLANMRSLGVTKVDVCCACGHQASADVSELPADLAVPDVKLRLRCSKCGKRPTETRPDWSNYRLQGTSKGAHDCSAREAFCFQASSSGEGYDLSREIFPIGFSQWSRRFLRQLIRLLDDFDLSGVEVGKQGIVHARPPCRPPPQYLS